LSRSSNFSSKGKISPNYMQAKKRKVVVLI